MTAIVFTFVLLWWWPGLIAPESFTTGHWTAFLALGFLAVGIVVTRRNLWLGLTLIGFSVSAAFNVLSNRTVLLRMGTDGLHADFTWTPMMVAASAALAAVIWMWLSEAKEKPLAVSISLAAALSGALSLAQYLGYRWPYVYVGDPMDLGSPPGLFGNPGLHGGALAMSFPLALTFLPAAVPFAALGLFLAKSSAGAAATAFSVIYLYGKSRYLILAVLFATLVILYDSPIFKVSADMQRLRVWKATLWLWPRYPEGRFLGDQDLPISWKSIVFGWGPGMYAKRFPIYDYRLFRIGLIRETESQPDKDRVKTGPGVTFTARPYTHPHNEFLSLLFEGGLVTFLPFLGFIGWFVWKAKRAEGKARAWFASLLAGLIFALWHFPFHSPQLGLLLLAAGSRIAPRGEKG